ncbi:MAG TPA: carbohydrate ABC transporter permease [bacterium]|nr:carbohydrate ABC transporter permease [bacterium]
MTRALRRAPVHGALWLVCAAWLAPAIGLFVSALRPAPDVAASGWWTVLRHPAFTLANYRDVLAAQGLGTSFFNSMVIAVPATAVPLLIAAYAAYAFAWMEFPGRRALFALVVMLLVIPVQTTLVPVLRLFTASGLTGTFPGLWLAHTGYGLPLAVFLLRNFIGGLPADVLDSAAIDGADAAQTFFRVVLPLSMPAVASLAIFQFLWVWNDLLVALSYLGGRPSVAPLTVTIAGLVSSLGGGWHLLTAAAFVSMTLPLILFFTLQRYFVRGLVAGAVKD